MTDTTNTRAVLGGERDSSKVMYDGSVSSVGVYNYGSNGRPTTKRYTYPIGESFSSRVILY